MERNKDKQKKTKTKSAGQVEQKGCGDQSETKGKDETAGKHCEEGECQVEEAISAKEAALWGKMDFVYPSTSRTVRIYIHSAGKDTALERASLKQHSYPKLHRYCRERGLDLLVIDLHTCDFDEYPDDHVAKEFCLREIDKCVDLSIGPSFVTFQAQKYGDLVLPRRIDVGSMRRIIKSLSGCDEDRELLLNWYTLDENSHPLVYVLAPVSVTVPYYSDGSEPDALSKWLEIQGKLLTILHRASANALSEDQREIYCTSEAEQEFHWCLLSNDDVECPWTTMTRFWFRRDITDLAENLDDASIYDNIDVVDGQLNEEAHAKLSTLRDTMLEKIPLDSQHAFDVTWSALCKADERNQYLEAVREMFEETMTQHIELALNKINASGDDSVILECMQNVAKAKEHIKNFIGRESFIHQIEESLKGRKSRTTLVLHGKPGTGKTALLSKLAEMLHLWYRTTKTAVVLRTNATGISWYTRKLLTSLCTQIHGINGELSLVDDIPVESSGICEYFLDLLANQRDKAVHICILLDGLDALDMTELTEITKWLPATTPKNVTFIVTVNDSGKIWRLVKEHYPDSLTAIPTLDAEDMTEVMQSSLKAYGHSLQPDQWAVMALFCPADHPSPFHLHLAANTARYWRAGDHISDCELPDDVEEVVTQMFERLEKKHGMDYVNVVFGFLSASCAGLGLGEIEELVATRTEIPTSHKAPSFPGVRLIPLLSLIHDTGYYLEERDVLGTLLYQWRNKMISDMAKTRYLPEENRADFHNAIIKYVMDPSTTHDDINGNLGSKQSYTFHPPDSMSRGFNTRALIELPHQLRQTNRINDFVDWCLLNTEYLEAKINITCVERVLSEFDAVDTGKETTNNDLRTVQACLETHKNALAEHSSSLALHLLQELTKSPDDMSDVIEKFLGHARSPAFDCLLSSKVRIALDKDYARLGKFMGATSAIQAIDISQDGTKCLSVSEDAHLRVWDTIADEQIINTVLTSFEPYLSCDYLPLARFCNGDRWAVLASTTILNFIEFSEGKLVHRIHLDENATLHIDFIGKLDLIFVVGEIEIEIWNIISAEETDCIDIPEPIKIEDETHAARLEDFITTHDTDVIFYRAGGTVVKIIHYETKSKTDTYALYGRKDALERVARFAVLPSGKLICFHFIPPIPSPDNLAPAMEATVDVVDITTTSKLYTFQKQDCGVFMSLEKVFPMGPHSFALTCHPIGSTVIRVYDIASHSITDAHSLPGEFINTMAWTNDGEIAFTTRNNQEHIEFIDLYKALDLKKQEIYSGDKDPEAEEILGELPGTRRYVLFMTKDMAIGVWDLAHRICVRILDIAFPGTYAACVSSSVIVGVDPTSGMLVAVDMLKGEIKTKVKDVPFQIRDGHCRVGVAHDGCVVVVGPKRNKLSGVDLETGKVKWTCAVGAGSHIGGVIVSDNGKVAICEEAAKPDDKKQQPKGPARSKLFVFNLQEVKRLSDLKLRTMMPLSTRLVLGEKAFLTPDGAYYVTLAATEEGDKLAVFDTKSGSVRTIPDVDESRCITLGYSQSMESCVMGCKNGQLRLCRLDSLAVDVFDSGKHQPVIRLVVSRDGVFVGCVFRNKGGTLHLYNLMNRTLHSVYTSNENIRHCYFTSQNEFLLLSRDGVHGLTQLCIHTATAAIITLDTGEHPTTNGSEGPHKKDKAPDTLSVLNEADAADVTRPSTGRRSARSRRRRLSNRSFSGGLPARDDDNDKKRLFVEDAYLDEMMEKEDLYGVPMEYECFD